ncbi:hypothetical protein QLX08_009361 [Tetragonisca angustula]|uniref:Uncharacterized protein n=1 Tax=Tetragonisca angustula TaxID=166442 RepID=A0AAW0ZGT4_9HYME
MPKWLIKKVNEDYLLAAVQTILWRNESRSQQPASVEENTKWLGRKLKEVSNCGMPKLRGNIQTSMHWWSEEINRLRQDTLVARRALQRYRRKKRGTLSDEYTLRLVYREKSRELKNAITEAKEKAWKELMKTLDQDPWGKPYRAVMKKIWPKKTLVHGFIRPGNKRKGNKRTLP